MRESIGQINLYNIIIVFFFIIMAIMIATITYQKAFRVNVLIVHSIEKYEGYNHLAKEEIVNGFDTLGYAALPGGSRCPDSWGGASRVTPSTMTADYRHNYCIYATDVETILPPLHYQQFIVVTYVAFDIPMTGFGTFPIVAKTNKIYFLSN